MKVMYSGSFDPVTKGHLDIIYRCSKKFDEVLVVVFDNNSKKHLFTAEERKGLIEKVTYNLDNVFVDLAEGMLVDYARENNIDVVIRGLRAVSDYEYEMTVASMNNLLYNGLETLFMLSSPNYSFISSSIVKEIAKLKGDISQMVPKVAEEALIKKFEEE
ncbi:Phosphopantetheine adenylyltransferase [Dethiosulfatibacter aminovorans DSM 17477]|uniref:Phosphopantetheine adenylyltransferase n=1 Tax=Dethiosulfatibacter aminovorans DSM 17477 TaxID=1121476 RepID=A0A1M6DHF8_9FIRM|nr:pantetheine-phosphate adenylyltransferase [Dethiosulfatibacter aminovorans]SHI72635.1 Phosphopantetheine adenylyltransferase [Dethiosulfatibacter aminovorans DSM 17477]